MILRYLVKEKSNLIFDECTLNDLMENLEKDIVPKQVRDNIDKYSDWYEKNKELKTIVTREKDVKTIILEAENWILNLEPSYKNKITMVRNMYKI